MKRFLKSRATIVLFLAAIGIAAGALWFKDWASVSRSGERFNLQLGGQVGQQYTVLLHADTTITGENYVSSKADFVTRSGAEYDMDILVEEVLPNGNLVLAMEVIEARINQAPNTESGGERVEKVVENWEGKTVIFERAPNGELVEMYTDTEDDRTRAIVESTFDMVRNDGMSTVHLPDGEVRIGESWPGGVVSLAFPSFGTLNMERRLTLVDIRSGPNGKLAVMEISSGEPQQIVAEEERDKTAKLTSAQSRGAAVYSFERQRIVSLEQGIEAVYRTYGINGDWRLTLDLDLGFKEVDRR